MNKARVERSALDGADRMTYMDDLGRVSGLVIDFDSSRLYWADLDRHNIVSVDLTTGGDRNVVVSDLVRPYGLTQFRDFIYWTDQGTTIERADKVSGQNRTKIRYADAAVMDISVIHSSRQIGKLAAVSLGVSSSNPKGNILLIVGLDLVWSRVHAMCILVSAASAHLHHLCGTTFHLN